MIEDTWGEERLDLVTWEEGQIQSDILIVVHIGKKMHLTFLVQPYFAILV